MLLFWLNILFCVLILSRSDVKIKHDSYKELLRDYDCEVLGDGRIVIDDAITTKELAALMKIVHSEPTLSKQKELTTVNDRGIIDKYKHVELDPYVHKHLVDIENQYKDSSSSTSHTSLKSKALKSSETDLMSMLVRVVSHAEAFFNKTIFVRSAAIFARRKIVIDEHRGESSPEKLNNASGWLVAVHTDGCTFSFNHWDCEPFETPEVATYFKGKDISVVVFLNEVSEDGGGEFVFLDPLERPSHTSSDFVSRQLDSHTSRNLRDEKLKSSQSIDSLAHQGSSYQSTRRYTRDSFIPAPTRHQIRRSLKAQAQARDSSGSYVSKAIPILAE